MNSKLRLGIMMGILATMLLSLSWFVYAGDPWFNNTGKQVAADRSKTQEEDKQANDRNGGKENEDGDNDKDEDNDEDGDKDDDNNGQKISIAELNRRCTSSLEKDGFGTVRLNRYTQVKEQRGRIDIPCRIILERNGGLSLKKTRLETKHLVISDLNPNGKTRVRIEDSTLTAPGKAGFLLQLSDFEDSVYINHSTIDYPLSVWVRVSDQRKDAPGGRIEVKDSTIRATDPQSEDGIQFVAGEIGGKAKFNKLKLDTGDPKPGYQNALLFAGKCEAKNIEGFPNRCGPEAILEGLNGGSSR